MIERPIVHPDRPRPKFRPLTAYSCMQKLIADKEDTEQVFHIIEALNGDNIIRQFNAFSANEAGRARIAEARELPPILDDHSWIEKLPEGSVGRAYIAFMEREGLSAQGLVDESLKMERPRFDDWIEWYGRRLRDTHDLYHVLSGYGRDALGEASLLAYTYGQHKGRGLIFIAYMGTRQIRKAVPREIDVMACFHEGRRNGAAARNIEENDIIALLHEPIEEVRERLNIRPPLAYRRALQQIAALGNVRELLAAA